VDLIQGAVPGTILGGSGCQHRTGSPGFCQLGEGISGDEHHRWWAFFSREISQSNVQGNESRRCPDPYSSYQRLLSEAVPNPILFQNAPSI